MAGNKFIRYSKLENWWNLEKTMSLYARDFNLGRTRTWLITEKLDGYNVCISNRYKEGPAVFSRNGNQLQPGHQELVKEYDWEKFFAFYPDVDFAYGEFAGPGIQKRVEYEEEKKAVSI
jgi:ATP-dependent RNA circularization protein (DNA/RNA ligase family)